MLRFSSSGGGAAYSLGRPISELSALFTDDTRLGELQSFAAKFDGILFDALDFLEAAKANTEKNRQFITTTAPPRCTWLSNLR
jgi:hypothetical protein